MPPARTQRLLWTPLPNGPTEDGRRLRVSAMVSPRLVASGPDDVLASFPDMVGWPAIVRRARFEVGYAGVVARASVVSEPDDRVHGLLLHGDTVVLSRAFEDRRGTHVLSYPVAAVERDLGDVYGQLAAQADGELPLLEHMRLRFAALGRGLHGRSQDELLDAIRRSDAVELADSPAARLNLVDLYNTPLAAPARGSYTKQGPDDLREDVAWQTYRTVPLPSPDSFRRSFDFHQIVSALSEYPELLRLTGLVVDLEVDRDLFPPGPQTAPLWLQVAWEALPETATAGVTAIADVLPQTMTTLDGQQFHATPRLPDDPSQIEGFLKVQRDDFAVVQVDVNGSALKLRHFAVNLSQLPPSPSPPIATAGGRPVPPDPVAAPPHRTGTPALRSGGLTLAFQGRAAQLEGRFARSGAMEDALVASSPVVLYQEDITRGYHVEARDSLAAEWQSLCRRDTRFTFVLDHSALDSADNEGTLRLAASGSADGHNADVLKLHEGLFTWSGWSLAAPPIGRAVKTDDSVGTPGGLAPPGLPLDVEHRVRQRSLPGLRYGRKYSFRLRVTDLAGNARAFDPRLDSPPGVATEPVEYLRYEPIEAPTVALVGTGAAVAFPGPGEDLAVLAIRSLNATPAGNAVLTSEQAQRHVVPPLSSQKQAELHGVLDAGGRLDPTTYAMLLIRDGALSAAVHPVTGKEFPTASAGFAIPFLPDPLAVECRVRIDGRTASGSVEIVRIPWYSGDAWPDAAAFRVEVLEVAPGGAPAVPVFDADARLLRVPLAKADQARVRIGHALSTEALERLGIWRWAQAHLPEDASERARLTRLAHDGGHWMLTPWRDVEIVHAVQRPLVEPAIENLAIGRPTGCTMASVEFATPVDTRSTEKLDLFCRWLDPVDDPAEDGPRARIGGGQRAAELKLLRLEAPGVNPPGRRLWTGHDPVHHEFGDTRYRRAGYKLTATTRFTKFLPDPLQDPDNADQLTLTSAEAIGFVPNSSPPPAPDIVYVIPTFGWTRSALQDEERSWRNGGGLRVYLRRPWLVSGYMEMLAVVLPRTGERSADPALSRFVTQWGADPTWEANPVDGAAPPAAKFALATTAGPIAPTRLDPVIPPAEGELPARAFDVTGLPLPGAPGTPPVDVVPHLVGWDSERKLWYADIVVDPGTAYTPFIRLALARYQPISAYGSHLSAVAVTEVVQLLPDRLAVLTRNGPLTYRVGVFGHAPDRGRRRVEVVVERLAADGGTDLGWEPLPEATVTDVRHPRRAARRAPAAAAHAALTEAGQLLAARRFSDLLLRHDLLAVLRPPWIREVDVQLPRPREGAERFRLVISEVEVRSVDQEHLQPPPLPEHDPRRRIVYLETVELV